MPFGAVWQAVCANRGSNIYRMKRTDGTNKEIRRKIKTPEQALASLMRYSSRAERSSGDALRLMRGWGVSQSDASGILRRLEEMNFIDDRRFAAAYVREKSEMSGWGIHKIRSALRAKGIAPDTIEQALAQLVESGRQDARLDEVIARKLRSVSGGTEYEIKGKLLRFGLSRGYGYDAVSDAVERALKSWDSPQEEGE